MNIFKISAVKYFTVGDYGEAKPCFAYQKGFSPNGSRLMNGDIYIGDIFMLVTV